MVGATDDLRHGDQIAEPDVSILSECFARDIPREALPLRSTGELALGRSIQRDGVHRLLS